VQIIVLNCSKRDLTYTRTGSNSSVNEKHNHAMHPNASNERRGYFPYHSQVNLMSVQGTGTYFLVRRMLRQ